MFLEMHDYDNSNATNYASTVTTIIPITMTTTNRDLTTFVLSYCIIGIVSLLSNILIFVVMACNKNLRTKTNFLLLHLAASGCLVILVGLPLQITNLKNNKNNSTSKELKNTKYNISCNLQGAAILLTYLVTIFSLVLIAVHRYVLVVKNFLYPKLFTWKRLVRATIFIWIVGMVICLPPVFGWSSYSYKKDLGQCIADWSHSTSYVMFIHMLSYLLPLVIMIFCYQQLLSHTSASSRRVTQYDFTLANTTSIRSNEVRLTFMLALVVFCFFTSFLPYCITMVIEGYMQKQSPKYLTFAAMMFIYANSILNFWIYAIMNTKFRKGLVGLARKTLSRCIMGQKRDEQCIRLETFPKCTKNMKDLV